MCFNEDLHVKIIIMARFLACFQTVMIKRLSNIARLKLLTKVAYCDTPIHPILVPELSFHLSTTRGLIAAVQTVVC